MTLYYVYLCMAVEWMLHNNNNCRDFLLYSSQTLKPIDIVLLYVVPYWKCSCITAGAAERNGGQGWLSPLWFPKLMSIATSSSYYTKTILPECLRNILRESNFPKFSGGVYPQTPLPVLYLQTGQPSITFTTPSPPLCSAFCMIGTGWRTQHIYTDGLESTQCSYVVT